MTHFAFEFQKAIFVTINVMDTLLNEKNGLLMWQIAEEKYFLQSG